MRSSQPGQWDDVRLDAPNLLVEKGLTLDVGGLTVQLESVPGHSDDSLIGWLPELGVLLAGDAAEDPLPEVRAPADIAAWADALERWSSESGLRVVVPGHGAVSGPKLLNRNARYLRALAEPASRPTGALDDARSAHPVETMLGGALSGYYHQLHSANVAAVADWRRNGGPTRTGV
jgi:glyoxylase-like metal-dependent hydrolase (beta-lactamase superfamily II)